MGKVKPKLNTEEKSEFGVTNKALRGQKVRQKWNHIFKKIYMKNGQKMSSNRNGEVVDANANEEKKMVKEEPVAPVNQPSQVETNDGNKTTKLNGKKIITDPIPSTSTGITANGRGKRKWEEIAQNGMFKRKFPHFGMMNGNFNSGFANNLTQRTGKYYPEDSSLDEDSSDYDQNGEFDLSSDVHYEDSEPESDNDMSELMAMHEMENNGLDSDYDEFCSEEESLDEEYSVGDESRSYDSDEIESEYFSDSEEIYEQGSSDEDEEEPENYHLYEGTSSDTDYDPGSDFVEDLYVAHGAAVVYSAKEITNQLPFTEDTDEPQVIDITDMLEQKDDDSSDSCPKLVPIKGSKLNGQTSPLSDKDSSDTSASCFDDSANQNNGSILLDDEFSSTSNDNSVMSIVESSSEEEIDENCSNIDTRDDFYICNSLNNNSPSCLLHLKKPIYVNGVMDVELLAGNAQIFGYKLPRKGSGKDTKAQIISARGYKLMNITPVESDTDEQMHDMIKSLNDQFLKEDLDLITNSFKSQSHALLLLTRSQINTKVKIVKKYTTGRYLFPEAMTIGQRNSHYLSEALLNTKIYTESSCKRPLKVLDQWNALTPKPNSRTLIVGGKNVGKSTFIEYLINKTLSEHSNHDQDVLLIDLDIGQPILFVPQVVSAIIVSKPILGNGTLTECGSVLKSFIFGDINVMLSPIKYIKCVKELLEYCATQEKLKTMPWIINTMGFQKGLGVELMAAIIKMTNPTIVVQIQHQIENFNFRNEMNETFVNNFTFNMFKEEIEDCQLSLAQKSVSYELIEIDSAMNEIQMESSNRKQEDPSLLPAEKRTVMMLAHLADIAGEYEWITDATPYAITNPHISIASSEKIPKNRDLETINGNIVYLCHSPSPSCDTSNQDQQISECLGIGLVRAIDIKHNLAYVHHSIPRVKMRDVNMLVLANVTPPKDIFLKQSNKVKGPIPNLYNTEVEFAGSRKIGRGNNSQYLNN